MLVAFDVSLPHSETDVSRIAVEDTSRSEHAIGNTVTGCGPEELENGSDLSAGCCHTSRSVTVSSHLASDSESHQCLTVPVSAVIESHVETSSDTSNRATGEQRMTNLEVQTVKSNDQAVRRQLITEADKAEELPQSEAVIQRRFTGRLSEKIRRTLQQNAKLDTPTRLSRFSAVIKKCDVRRDVDVIDADPFYGLPDKVRQLLEMQRSITELYRMFLFYCLYLASIHYRREGSFVVVHFLMMLFCQLAYSESSHGISSKVC